jgi:hypothetical protein
MIKKIILTSLVLSQLAISCSSDDSKDETKPETEQTLAEQIANIVKQPYSNLTPAEQKQKLEVEANEMLVQLDKSKSSNAIEAIKNLGRLFSLNHIDLFDGKSDNGVEEALNISGVYGIYTWNNAQQNWTKTASLTELKFVFPAKASQTVNNAVLTSKSTPSDIKIKNIDTYGESSYNHETGSWTQTPSLHDWFFLPTATDATLTIDGGASATFTQTAKYSNGKEVPNEFAYKITLNDGYIWEMSGTKATENTSKASFTFNGKNLVQFTAGSTSQIDALLDNKEVVAYKGKANGLIRLMDNFIIVADADLATEAADDIALRKNNTRPAYPEEYNNPKNNYKEYYTASNAYEKRISEGTAANFNKNMKLALVSKKDGTKIAEIVLHSEERGNPFTFNLPIWVVNNSSTGGYWSWYSEKGERFSQPYLEEIYYLKFNDKTEVEMSVYFSAGFTELITKFNDFTKSFKK